MTEAIDEIRILAPTGVCGSGFLEESFERGLAQKPHFIGCDAGSTDPDPAIWEREHALSRATRSSAICA